MKLVGDCNRCGLCCAPVIGGVEYRCEFLAVTGKIGEANATVCVKYWERTDQMPVRAISKTGRVAQGLCWGNGNEPEVVLIAPYIGKGCSLQVVDN